MIKKIKTQFAKTLLAWYHKHKRDLPWRATKDPYKIWVSEIMLQQTTVAAVIDYYHRFLKRFPHLQSLAKAREEEVLALWSGLGYYTRAKNLHKASQKIVSEHGGQFPKDPEKIAALPGIGRYTLGAVASIAFNQPLPLVDGNVIRVYSRLLALRGSPKDTKFQKEIWKIAEEIISSPSPYKGEGWGEVWPECTRVRPPPPPSFVKRGSPGDFNQALMELGATVCTPQNPTCLVCPVIKFCKGRALGPEQFPERKKGPSPKVLKRVAAVFMEDQKILLQLSEKHRWMKGLWQIPSIFSENGKAPEKILSAFLKHWGLGSLSYQVLKPLRHAITHHKITLHAFLFQGKGLFQKMKGFPSDEMERKWFSIKELASIPLPSADRKVLSTLPQK